VGPGKTHQQATPYNTNLFFVKKELANRHGRQKREIEDSKAKKARKASFLFKKN